ncbi:hypothetical protein ACFOOM_22270 [Streptomyces echinoruber]|nr:hypothetical protein [Streptomyces echinoruber]
MRILPARDNKHLQCDAAGEAMDLEIAPSNVNNVRLKLKRPAERGILIEPEQGLFTKLQS